MITILIIYWVIAGLALFLHNLLFFGEEHKEQRYSLMFVMIVCLVLGGLLFPIRLIIKVFQ